MPDAFGDQQLEAVLASAGRLLVVPDGPVAIATSPAGPAPRRSVPTVWLAAAALLLALVLAGLVVAPVREAVADWLGIGSTRIEPVPGPAADPRGLPSFATDAVPATPAAAARELGGPLPNVERLGDPAALAIPPEGGVLMAWPRGATTLWVHHDDGGGAGFVKKLLNVPDQATPVRDVGDGAVLIEGDHVLVTPARRVAAGRVLLWTDGGLEYRLESDLRPDAMAAIARSISPARR